MSVTLAPIGTLYLDPTTGDVYRLRSYSPTDWYVDEIINDKPTFSVGYSTGGFSHRDALPNTAFEIWRP